jgi:hypothetical protein
MHSLIITVFRSVAALSVTLLLTATAAHADDAGEAEAGSVCPDPGVVDVLLEELSVTLDRVMSAQEAVRRNDMVEARLALVEAATALRLAFGRGAAARTRLLLDAVMKSKAGEDYSHMLGWFPTLHSAVRGLTGHPHVDQAERQLGIAEDIFKGEREGNGLEHLQAAQDLLGCDKLDLPMRQANETIDGLYQTVVRGERPKGRAFAAASAPLQRSISTALEMSRQSSAP